MAIENDVKTVTITCTSLGDDHNVVVLDCGNDWDATELISTLMTAIVGVISEHGISMDLARSVLDSVLDSVTTEVSYDA